MLIIIRLMIILASFFIIYSLRDVDLKPFENGDKEITSKILVNSLEIFYRFFNDSALLVFI